MVIEPLSLIALLIALAAQFPFAFRRRRSWWPWAAGLALASLCVAVILILIYLGSAIAGTSGDMARVHSAWRFALLEGGAGLLIGALLAPFVVAVGLRASEDIWSPVARRSGTYVLIAVHFLMAIVTFPLAYMGTRDFQKTVSAARTSQLMTSR